MTPLIVNGNKWKLSKFQKTHIESIRASDICSEIGKALLKSMQDMLSGGFGKYYEFLLLHDKYSSKETSRHSLIKWIVYTLNYNQFCLKKILSINRATMNTENVDGPVIFSGAQSVMVEVIRNSDIYCNPLIVPNENVLTSPSIFLNSKPNIIISIGKSKCLILFIFINLRKKIFPSSLP